MSYGSSDMRRGWVCLLNSQRGGLCRLLSYNLPAPAPAFHSQLPDASWEYHISALPVGPLSGSPPGGTRKRLQSWGSRGRLLLGACFLGLCPQVTLQHSFTWARAVPSCAAPESGLLFSQHLQTHPHHTPLRNHGQLPSPQSSEVLVSAL